MICRALNLGYADGGWPERPGPATCANEAVRILSSEARKHLCRSSGIAFARRVGFEAVLGAHAARLVVDPRRVPADRTAIIAAGTQGHVQTAIAFADRACRSGATMVDPISFPSVLPSFTPTAIAAALGTTGPALTIGHGESAFKDALWAAATFVEMGLADGVAVLAISHGSAWREGVAARPPAHCAVAAWVDRRSAEMARQLPNGAPTAVEPSAAGHELGPARLALAFALK